MERDQVRIDLNKKADPDYVLDLRLLELTPEVAQKVPSPL